MDFSKVINWVIPNGEASKVTDSNGKVIWQKWQAQINVLDLIGYPDFSQNNGPLGCVFSENNGDSWDSNSLYYTYAGDTFRGRLTNGGDYSSEGDSIFITDASDKSQVTYWLFTDNSNHDGETIFQKYSNYASEGTTGTYEWVDIRSDILKSGLVYDTDVITSSWPLNIDFYKLKDKTYQGVFYLIVGYDYFDFGQTLSWTLTSQGVGATASYISFDVTDSDQRGWTISSDESWLNADTTSGTGDEENIYLVYNANTSSSSRTGTVQLLDSSANDSVVDTVTITQAGSSVTYSISANSTSTKIAAAGATNTIGITASHPSSVTCSSSSSWCTAKYSSSNKNVSITADANLGNETRTAKVTLICGNKSVQITVTQDAYSELSVASSIETLAIASSLSAIIKVTSPKRSFTFTSSLTGATVARSRVNNDNLIITTTGYNDGTSNKTLGTVTITDGVQTKTVTIIQPYARMTAYLTTITALGEEARYDLSSSSSSKRISITSGSTWKLTITSNTKWKVQIPNASGWTWNNGESTDSGNGYYTEDAQNDTIELVPIFASSATSNCQLNITYGSSFGKTYGSFYFTKG